MKDSIQMKVKIIDYQMKKEEIGQEEIVIEKGIAVILIHVSSIQ